MAVKEGIGVRSQRLDHGETKGKVLGKMPIHDVNVQPVCSGIQDTAGLECEGTEITGQQRGGNDGEGGYSGIGEGGNGVPSPGGGGTVSEGGTCHAKENGEREGKRGRNAWKDIKF